MHHETIVSGLAPVRSLVCGLPLSCLAPSYAALHPLLLFHIFLLCISCASPVHPHAHSHALMCTCGLVGMRPMNTVQT